MELNIPSAETLRSNKTQYKANMKAEFVEALELAIPNLVNELSVNISYAWWKLTEYDVKDVYDALKSKGYKVAELGDTWNISL